MGDLINGRTPEEIIEANRSCSRCFCDECAYFNAIECQTDLKRDCVTLIKHLEAKQPKWISVEERLPEDKKETADCYLVTDGAFIWMAYWGCKEWQFAQCTDSPYVIDWTDITHWMPLPEPPEEEHK